MLGWSSEEGWNVTPSGVAILVAIVAFTFYRNRKRRRTLRRQANGLYVWIEWHGGQKASWNDPREPGGDWDSGSDSDGGGDGGD